MNARRVGVIGAGVAGAACARALADAGWDVTVVDKSRGVGGRMATRRATWSVDGHEQPQVLFDHGAPWFHARTPEFQALLESALEAGIAQPCEVQTQGASPDLHRWVTSPDMPALCRWMLRNLPVQTHCTVDGITRQGSHWHLLSDGTPVVTGLDAVVVAIPPQQAAPLWQAHRPDWAERARAQRMSPCWTLMAITESIAATGEEMEMLPPQDSPLERIIRQDRKPGRVRLPAGRAQWVAHARADWSQQHLETAPQEILVQLQSALSSALATASGGLLDDFKWLHAVVHRWRYAQPVPDGSPVIASSPTACWWDGQAGLGACGDHLLGDGVEGAWRSGHALARQIVETERLKSSDRLKP